MSAPPVRIESKAWTDTRYTTLALELGLQPGDADVALIRCAAIWRWQTEHYTGEAPTYVVDRSVVNGALKSLAGADAMVAAGLAELQADGRLRIKGGIDDKGKSRIDWLWREREKNRAKGHARHEKAKAAGWTGGRFQPDTSHAPAGHQPDGGTAPAADQPATSSPDSGLRPLSDLSLTRARDPAEDSDLVALSHVAVDLLNAGRDAMDPARKEPRLSQSEVTGLPARQLRDHLRAISRGDRDSTLRHAVKVLVAMAKDESKIGLLRLGELAGQRRWDQLIKGSVADYRRSRGGDGPGGPSRPPSATRGQVAAKPIQRPDGEQDL